MSRACSLVAVCLLFAATAPADDWPQFRGPQRNGISLERGLLPNWPESGPPVAWRIPLGAAFSSVAVVDGRLFTMDSRGEEEFVVSLNARDGSEVWRVAAGAILREGYGDGPRSTPTVEAEMLWALASYGNLMALRPDDGTLLWRVPIMERYKTAERVFGFATSPLVTEDLVIISAGVDGDGVLALDKSTGATVWQARTGPPSYSSPLFLSWRGNEQLVFFDHNGVVALGPRDGGELWRVPFAESSVANVTTPLYVEPDLLFVSTSYDVGALAIRLALDQEVGVTASEGWRNPRMRNHFHSSVTRDGLIFGFDSATLKCLDAGTGEERWAKRGGLGKGSLIWADGKLVVLTENGKLMLVDATGEGYRELGSLQVFDSRSWTPPSLAGGRLYLRNQSEVVAVDLHAADDKLAATEKPEAPTRPEEGVPAETQPVSAQAVVERYLAARGGESLARLATFRLTGHYILDGTSSPITFSYKRPGLFRYEIRLPDGRTSVEASDGKTAWRDKTDIEFVLKVFGIPTFGPLPAEEAAYFHEDDADLLGELVGRDTEGQRVELVGAETLDNGIPVYHLRLTLPSGNVQEWYVDRRSYRLVRKAVTAAQIQPTGKMGTTERRWDFINYREVAGVLFPTFFEREDFHVVRTFRVEEIEVDVELDDAIFTLPEAPHP